MRGEQEGRGLALTPVPAPAGQSGRRLSGLSGLQAHPRVLLVFFILSLSLSFFFFLIKITMKGPRRLSFSTSQPLGPSSASVAKNVPCHRGRSPLFEVSG